APDRRRVVAPSRLRAKALREPRILLEDRACARFRSRLPNEIWPLAPQFEMEESATLRLPLRKPFEPRRKARLGVGMPAKALGESFDIRQVREGRPVFVDLGLRLAQVARTHDVGAGRVWAR